MFISALDLGPSNHSNPNQIRKIWGFWLDFLIWEKAVIWFGFDTKCHKNQINFKSKSKSLRVISPVATRGFNSLTLFVRQLFSLTCQFVMSNVRHFTPVWLFPRNKNSFYTSSFCVWAPVVCSSEGVGNLHDAWRMTHDGILHEFIAWISLHDSPNNRINCITVICITDKGNVAKESKS